MDLDFAGYWHLNSHPNLNCTIATEGEERDGAGAQIVLYWWEIWV